MQSYTSINMFYVLLKNTDTQKKENEYENNNNND